MRYDITDIKNKLKENYTAFAKEYEVELEASYSKKVRATQPGQAAPGRGFTDLEAAAFRKRAEAYKQRAEAIISNVKDQIRADVTAAPSTEAANYISMLSRRKHVSPSEIQFAAEVYGKNFSSYSALQEIAAKNKIYIEDHPTRGALEDVQAFEHNNSYYTLETISSPDRSPAVTARLYAAGIDGFVLEAEADPAAE